jgi:hypothetical protein
LGYQRAWKEEVPGLLQALPLYSTWPALGSHACVALSYDQAIRSYAIVFDDSTVFHGIPLAAYKR